MNDGAQLHSSRRSKKTYWGGGKKRHEEEERENESDPFTGWFTIKVE